CSPHTLLLPSLTVVYLHNPNHHRQDQIQTKLFQLATVWLHTTLTSSIHHYTPKGLCPHSSTAQQPATPQHTKLPKATSTQPHLNPDQQLHNSSYGLLRKQRLHHHACSAPLATSSLPRPAASTPSSSSAHPRLKSGWRLASRNTPTRELSRAVS
ncbi:hypothetical protein CCUS01_12010, partial [Colletotrichum cuscutae]